MESLHVCQQQSSLWKCFRALRTLAGLQLIPMLACSVLLILPFHVKNLMAFFTGKAPTRYLCFHIPYRTKQRLTFACETSDACWVELGKQMFCYRWGREIASQWKVAKEAPLEECLCSGSSGLISASGGDSFVTCFSSSNPLFLFATDLGILMPLQSHYGVIPDIREQS